MTQSPMKIGELATRSGLSVETIRFYEREKLLPAPARSMANYRLYNEFHVSRLQFIRHCRSLDMTLDEIRLLLDLRDTPNDNCSGVNALIDRHMEHVAVRIKELKALQTQLKALRKQCASAQPMPDCGILQGLDAADGAAVANLGSHSGGCH